MERMKVDRPDFLKQPYENGATLIAAFEKATTAERYAADKFLMWATCYGSLTWQEQCLAKHVADLDDLEQTQFAREARD